MTPIHQQIEAMHSIANRHYPDDAAQRNEFLVRVLTERLQSLAWMQNEGGWAELRRAGFSPEEIALGSQEVVRT
jgi:hypothetical protein